MSSIVVFVTKPLDYLSLSSTTVARETAKLMLIEAVCGSDSTDTLLY